MNVWTIPEVRQAVESILHAAQLVRLEHPELPPLRRLQEARRRCPEQILLAAAAVTRAQEMEANGCWREMPINYSRHGGGGLTDHLVGRKQAPQERYARIREIAAANPDWSHRRIAEYLGCGSTTVGTALRQPPPR